MHEQHAGGGGDAPHDIPHHSPQHFQPQDQQWPPGIPTYPEFYQRFQAMELNMHNIGANQVEIRQDQQYMRSTMDRVQQDVRHSFEYLFAGLEQVHPGYFSNPPSFPY